MEAALLNFTKSTSTSAIEVSVYLKAEESTLKSVLVTSNLAMAKVCSLIRNTTKCWGQILIPAMVDGRISVHCTFALGIAKLSIMSKIN